MLAGYATVKQDLLAAITRGDYVAGDRLPSESELTARYRLSRPTVNRALRELQQAGAIVRVAGVGSFVAEAKHDVPVSMVQDIADEIRADGQAYDCEVQELGRTRADAELAVRLGVPADTELLRSVIVHRGNGVPVQYEARLVNPAFCPDYLDSDFGTETPHRVLTRAGPVERVDHMIEAGLPGVAIARLLRMKATEPCLTIHRRTWSRAMVASVAFLVYPGDRYRISGTFTTAS
ncbi:MAG: UTRA domain-containing protein [Burkholderiaceae bacterium]|nr:UTRA domain-containing protein [Burkholderiaceae bacterium]